MPDKKFKLRRIVETELESVVDRLNEALTGKGLRELEPVIGRLGRGGQVPHWFNALCEEGVLPNLDGKTIGSILEMLFVGILETGILQASGVGQLKVNPARGVDLPDLDLGIKSPSENYCTSEPFFSAYERLYGNESDCVILLTNYQTAKKNPPLRLQVKSARYLRGSEIADAGLCAIARMQRDWLVENDEGQARPGVYSNSWLM